jgi:hypothetical protein
MQLKINPMIASQSSFGRGEVTSSNYTTNEIINNNLLKEKDENYFN